MCVLGAIYQDIASSRVKRSSLDVDKGEKVLKHESVVRFWVVSGNSNVFILYVSLATICWWETYHVDCKEKKSG
jgi:hypothetical protein